MFPSATHLQVSVSTPTVVKCVEVQIEGVPAWEIRDTGSDITIVRGSAFQEIVTKSNLKKQDFSLLIGQLLHLWSTAITSGWADGLILHLH